MEESQLARLSPELRNRVYEYAFLNGLVSPSDCNGVIQPGLTRACHQLRSESLGMFYHTTQFRIRLARGHTRPFTQWLTAIGAEACLLIASMPLENNFGFHFCDILGTEQTATILKARGGNTYYITPLRSLHYHHMREIVPSLRRMGLGVAQICVRPEIGYKLARSYYVFMPLQNIEQLPK